MKLQQSRSPRRNLPYVACAILLSFFVSASPADSLEPVAESLRATSASGKYLYVQVMPADGASFFSLRSISLSANDQAAVTYEKEHLLALVERTVRGKTYPLYRESGNAESGVRGVGGSADSTLLLRLPIPKESTPLTSLKIAAAIYVSDDTGLVFTVGATTDPGNHHSPKTDIGLEPGTPIGTVSATLDDETLRELNAEGRAFGASPR